MKHRPIMPPGSIQIDSTLAMALRQHSVSRQLWESMFLSILGTVSLLLTFLTMFAPQCDVRIVLLFSVASTLFFSAHAASTGKTHYSLLVFLLAYAVVFYWKRETFAAGFMYILNDVYQAIYYTDWEYFYTNPDYDVIRSTTMFLCLAMALISWMLSFAVISFRSFFFSLLVTFPFVELGYFFGVVPEHTAAVGLAAFWCGVAAMQLADGKSKLRHKEQTGFFLRKHVFYPLSDLKFLLTDKTGFFTALIVFALGMLAEGSIHVLHYERPEKIREMRTEFQYYAASIDLSDMSTVFPFLKKKNDNEMDPVVELGRIDRRQFENRVISSLSMTALPKGSTYLKFSTYQSYEKSRWRAADESALDAAVMQTFEDADLYPPEFLYYSVLSLAGQTAELELIAPSETIAQCIPYGFARNDAVKFRGDVTARTGTQSYKVFCGESFEELLVRTISYDVPAGMLIEASPEKHQKALTEMLAGREETLVQFPQDRAAGSVYYGSEDDMKRRAESAVLAAAGYTDYAFCTYTAIPDSEEMKFVHSLFGDLTDGFDARNATPAETMILLGRLRERLCASVEYSLSPGKTPPGEDYIYYFLAENQSGYCTHYATTGTILARMAGIPARYCEGYLIGNAALRPQETADGLRYSADILDSNAHAWTEIYLDGFGWMPFEFTYSYFTPPELPTEPVAEPEPVTEDPTEAMPVTEPPTTIVPIMTETVPVTEVSEPAPPDSPVDSRRMSGMLAGAGLLAVILLLIAARRRAVLSKRELLLSDPIGDAAAVCAWRLLLKRLERCGVNTQAGSSDALLQECLQKCGGLLTGDEITSVIQIGTKLRYSPHGLKEPERETVIHGYRMLTEKLYQQANPLQKIWLKWFRHYV